MALVAKSIGWRKDEETGADEFTIVLVAQTQGDVPALTFHDVIKQVPLRLARRDDTP